MNEESAALCAADRFHAFVEVRPDPASGAGEQGPGALAGLTIGVKDNIEVRGLPFTAGHPLFEQRRAPRDAAAVTQLRAAGGRILGVTRTDSGGFGVTTPEVVNPMAENLVAGGSSGGSAAAVAAGLVNLGLGTDTGGSVRIPAACTGIFGFKPSWGRVSLDGTWPLAPALDHVGVMARTLELLQHAAEVLVQQPFGQAHSAPVIGVDAKMIDACDTAVRGGFQRALQRLRDAGLTVRNVDLPAPDVLTRVHGTLVLAQGRDVYSSVWPQHAARLGPAAAHALRAAEALDAGDVQGAWDQARAIKTRAAQVFEHVDVLLAPTLSIMPPARDQFRVTVRGVEGSVVRLLVQQACLANLCGLPALSAPLLPAPGQPVKQSLQIMAAVGRDALAFDCAQRLAAVFSSC